MKGFITVHLINAGALTVGVASIVSIEGLRQKRNGPLMVQIRLVDGRMLDIEEGWDDVEGAIEAATEPLSAPTHPVPNPDGSYPIASVLVPKRRGRPPKPKEDIKP